jgi:RES domain
MLEELQRRGADHRVYRFANLVDFSGMLEQMDLEAGDIEEILEFLGESRDRADAEWLLDAPFTPKPQLAVRRSVPTRFSDGSLRVFYSSLESETAELEVLHWYAGAALGSAARVTYYDRFRCHFRGPAVDLRPNLGEWPFLTGDGEEAYASCQALAREAVGRDLGGLLTPSARRASGTNVPVFRRETLSEPEILGFTAFSRDASGEVTVRPSRNRKLEG